MTARPNLNSIPGAGITVDGIVDVLGGKSIVVGRLVGATNAHALKGELLSADGAGAVKTAAQNEAIAGIAVSSALTGEIISVLRHGIARLVVHADAASALAVGDNVAVFGAGQVCKLGDNGIDGANATTTKIGEVSAVGDGFVDVELNLLGTAV